MAKAPAAPLFKHVDFIDVNDDGINEEVAVVKKSEDGTLHYIDIATLDPIDKGRLKAIVTGQHADKYELWELLSQSKLSNGMNALDFFHTNLIKVKKAPGSNRTQIGGGLMDAKAITGQMPGVEFANPSEGVK